MWKTLDTHSYINWTEHKYARYVEVEVCDIVKVKQSHYRPGEAQRVPGDRGSQIARQLAHEGGMVDMYIFILDVTDLLIPCLEVCALNFYSRRTGRLTTSMIHLKTYIPVGTKMRTKFLHCSVPCSRFKTCNIVNITHISDLKIKSNLDSLADKWQHW